MQRYPTRRSFLFSVACFLWALCSPVFATSAFAQSDLPFDLFDAPIDNMQIYRHFERTATRMMKSQEADFVEEFQKQLSACSRQSSIERQALQFDRLGRTNPLYRHMVKSTIYVGELYNCGRCDRTHAGFAGGVMVSANGLALTNYHVLEARESGRTEGLFAMTWDGRVWGVEEVLFASEKDDVALVQLQNDNGYRFHAAPIAEAVPDPMDPVRIISHPYGEFFVMTEGEVSRYAKMRRARDGKSRGVWMEVTAPFGSGSSGCGVFNNQGEVVGVVSSIRPLFRNGKDSSDRADEKRSYVEMLIRKCVPLEAINAGFAD